MSLGSSAVAVSTDVDTGVLRDHLLRADPGVLVAVLAQMTGDASVIDRYGAAIDHVPDPPERAGRTDAATAAALADEIVAALSRPRPADAIPADNRELFAALLPIALGSDVDDEQVDLLLEQGGFRPGQPTLPRTTPIPSTTTMASRTVTRCPRRDSSNACHRPNTPAPMIVMSRLLTMIVQLETAHGLTIAGRVLARAVHMSPKGALREP